MADPEWDDVPWLGSNTTNVYRTEVVRTHAISVSLSSSFHSDLFDEIALCRQTLAADAHENLAAATLYVCGKSTGSLFPLPPLPPPQLDLSGDVSERLLVLSALGYGKVSINGKPATDEGLMTISGWCDPSFKAFKSSSILKCR